MHFSISVERSLLNTPTDLLTALSLSVESKHSNLLTFFIPPSFLIRYFRQTLLRAGVTGAVDLSVPSSRQQSRGTNPDPWSRWDARDVRQPRDEMQGRRCCRSQLQVQLPESSLVPEANGPSWS